jgi:hypothetical protein
LQFKLLVKEEEILDSRLAVDVEEEMDNIDVCYFVTE